MAPERAPSRIGHLWIIGSGRTGLSLGLLLHRNAAVERLTITGRRPAAPEHPLFPADAEYRPSLDAVPDAVDGIVIAVPDGAIREVADRIAALPVPGSIPVLHTSGSRSTDVLGALAVRGHPVGSAHPLAAIADPVSGAERLRGVAWGIEGTGSARALAETVVQACGGRMLSIAPGGKPLYHAAAVFASNYAVALLAVAERLMDAAGVPGGEARTALAGLARGAVENVALSGPAAALTGPVVRGDVETVALHLERLSEAERPLYCSLGREALRLARQTGLDSAAAARLADLLGEAE